MCLQMSYLEATTLPVGHARWQGGSRRPCRECCKDSLLCELNDRIAFMRMQHFHIMTVPYARHVCVCTRHCRGRGGGGRVVCAGTQECTVSLLQHTPYCIGYHCCNVRTSVFWHLFQINVLCPHLCALPGSCPMPCLPTYCTVPLPLYWHARKCLVPDKTWPQCRRF